MRQDGSTDTKVVRLYAAGTPFWQQMMDVPGGHQIYVEQCGNPDGIPVIVLHGGPGGGCSPAMRRFFNPEIYRIILFDQRGCGRSRPHACVENNTTWDLLGDIERIREALNIETWCVFGGSWGAALSLIYAQSHPDRVRYLILRGIFLMTRAELDWFYGGGAAQFFPDQWAELTDLIPKDERGDLIAAYHKRLFVKEEEAQVPFARAWAKWENSLAVLERKSEHGMIPAGYARAFSRIENHYFTHHGFLETDGQILRDMPRIAHIPGVIIQGRYDMVCPPHTAVKLHQAWPKSDLQIISAAGHAMSEPRISAALLAAMDYYGLNFHKIGQ